MQTTWNDTNFEESVATTSKDAGYDPNDFLAFISTMKFVHDSDSDDKFTYEQKVGFLSNLVVKLEKLIKSYLKDHDILEAHKNKIDVLIKLVFFQSKHHSLLENNNVLTQKMKNNKPSSSINEVFHL